LYDKYACHTGHYYFDPPFTETQPEDSDVPLPLTFDTLERLKRKY